MSNLEEKEYIDLAPRVDPGCSGRQIRVISNCFKSRLLLDALFQYDIVFDPPIEQDATDERRRALNVFHTQLQQILGVYFMENKRIWSQGELKQSTVLQNEDETRSVEITKINRVDLLQCSKPQRNQAKHIVLQKAIRATTLERIGRNFFDKKLSLSEGDRSQHDIILQRGRQRIRAWPGFEISIEEAAIGDILRVNPVFRLIHLKSLWDTVTDFYRAEQDGNRQFDPSGFQKKISDEFCGRAVLANYGKRRIYRIVELDWKKGPDDTFLFKEQRISYREYFSKQYGQKLITQRSPLMIMDRGKRDNTPIYLPPELCYLTGLDRKMKLVREIREATTLKPVQRLQKSSAVVAQIKEKIRILNEQESSDISASMSQMQLGERHLAVPLELDHKPYVVNARVLEMPCAVFKRYDGREVREASQVLDRDYMKRPFIFHGKTPRINRLALCYEVSEQNLVREFWERHVIGQSRRLQFCGDKRLFPNDMGENFMMRVPIEIQHGDVPKQQQYIRAIEKQLGQLSQQPDFVLAVLPRGFYMETAYGLIKRQCNTILGIPSQCVLPKTLEHRAINSITANIILQMAAKVGAKLWKVPFNLPNKNPTLKNSIVIGIDVNHDKKSNKSTAGFVVSAHPTCTNFLHFTSQQAYGSEIIADIQDLTRKAFNALKKKWADFVPSGVIVYRDGVSNSQLETVVRTELSQISESIKEFYGPTNAPKLTCVIVQKRVSMRFVKSQDMSSIDPGTVVDTEVVSSQYREFYLVPHNVGNKQTQNATPTRCIVVKDDIGFTNDDIQSFTNQLCHMYYNWPGPIRVPAPVKYAHKLAHLCGSSGVDCVPAESLQGLPIQL